jgi:hypothetical protein
MLDHLRSIIDLTDHSQAKGIRPAIARAAAPGTDKPAAASVVEVEEAELADPVETELAELLLLTMELDLLVGVAALEPESVTVVIVLRLVAAAALYVVVLKLHECTMSIASGVRLELSIA